MPFFSDSILLTSASLVIEGLGDLQSQASVLNTVLYVYLVKGQRNKPKLLRCAPLCVFNWVLRCNMRIPSQ